MVKRQEYNRRGNNQGGLPERGQKNAHEQGAYRENAQNRNFSRDNTAGNPARYNKNAQHAPAKNFVRVKAEETVEDIKRDIQRIEKEIQLELKEIRGLKL